jgi:hypothetical protein
MIDAGSVRRRQPVEHARDLERMICVDLAPEPRAVSLGDLDFFDLPRPGFRTEGAGETREPGPIRQSPPGSLQTRKAATIL